MEIESLNMVDVFVQGTFLFLCLVTGLFFVFRDNVEDYKSPDKVNSLSNSVSNFLIVLASLFQLNWNLKSILSKGKSTTQTIKESVTTGSANNVSNSTTTQGSTNAVATDQSNDNNKVTKNDDKEEPKFNILSLLPLVVITIFIVGILGKGVANEWMDSDHRNHFYLKSLWAKSILDQGKIKIDSTKYVNNFRELMRKRSFELIFDKSPDDPRIYNQLFYNAKHEIMDVNRGKAASASSNNDIYSKYIKESQKLAEYSRVFALGFFFVMSCVFLNFWMMIVRFLWKDDDPKPNNEVQGENDSPKEKEKRFSAPDGIIFIFLVFSVLIIKFFLNPNFESYSVSRTTSFAVWFIIYFGILVFVMAIFPGFKKIKFTFFIYSTVYLISISGYFISSKSWLFAEEEAMQKIFGTFKTKHLTNSVEEIKYMRDSLLLDANYKEIAKQNLDSAKTKNNKKDSLKVIP